MAALTETKIRVIETNNFISLLQRNLNWMEGVQSSAT